MYTPIMHTPKSLFTNKQLSMRIRMPMRSSYQTWPELTCTTLAPHWRYWRVAAALSTPPVAIIWTGEPPSPSGPRARATADTARRPIGRTAVPDMPPYVVLSWPTVPPTPGHGPPPLLPPTSSGPSAETVFTAVTPSAPPRRTAARDTATTSVTLGVILTNTGIAILVPSLAVRIATRLTHREMFSTSTGSYTEYKRTILNLIWCYYTVLCTFFI